MSEKTNLSILLQELQKTVDMRGLDATVAILQNSRQINEGDQTIKFVVLSVCNFFSVSFKSLTTQKAVKDDSVIYCRGFIVFYLRQENFRVPWSEIETVLKRAKSNLWRCRKLILDLRPKFPLHQPWIEHKTGLDKIISNYPHNK